MKIVTWNINSVRLRLELIKDLYKTIKPDLICLQEIKVANDQFPVNDIKNTGYKYVYFSGEKSYNGVAFLSLTPLENINILELYNSDKRHIGCKIGNYEIHNFYFPAGGDEPDIDLNPKFKHKLAFVDLVKKWFDTKYTNSNKNIILLGDFNIAPYENDVWSTKQLRNVISHTSVERTALSEFLLSANLCDVARYCNDYEQKLYTWWSYRNRDWKKSNRGRRLDHIWVSKNLCKKIKEYKIIKNARDWNRPSDHVPVVLTLDI